MTCSEIRDKLTEHALGVLPAEESAEVERHIQWWPGCLKEHGGLLEGLAASGLSLPPSEPPARLEELVVDRVTAAAGRRAGRPRSGVRALAAAAVLAAVLAVGSLGWAFAMRGQVQDLKSRVRQTQTELHQLALLLATTRDNGKAFEGQLLPSAGHTGGGTAIIWSAPSGDDFIFAEVSSIRPLAGPYTLSVEDGSGALLAGGRLVRTNNGTYILAPQWFARDLSRAHSISVSNRSGRVILTARMLPYSA